MGRSVEKAEWKRARVAPAETLDRLATEVARVFEVRKAEIRGGIRRQGVVKARAALAWMGRVELALSTRMVARAAGVSSVSVVRLLERGHAALDDRGIQPAELLKICIP